MPLLGGDARLLCAAAAVRIALVAGGRLADALWEKPYTDVDYSVLTDGARLVASGGSPYARATYRYPPLLAWLLVPNVIVAEWGKLLFCAADMCTGVLLLRLLRRQRLHDVASACVAAFLLHPFAINVSTRGNADALVTLAVVAALCLLLDGRTACAGAVHGLAVHLKLFPVVYAVPIALWLAQPRGLSGAPAAVDAVHGWRSYLRRRARYQAVAVFGCASVAALAALTGLSYAAYGHDFLQHALLYHVGRTDPRHNFSPWWLPQYYSLAAAAQQGSGGGAAAADAVAPAGTLARALYRALSSPRAASLCASLPQLGLVLFLGCAYGRSHLPLALCAQTFAFVAWNRVVTAQYFHWYLAMLPLVLPLLRAGRMSARTGAALAAVWAVAELGWSWPALHLELRGQAVHTWVWAGSCAFFVANAGVLCSVLACISEGGDLERGCGSSSSSGDHEPDAVRDDASCTPRTVPSASSS